MTAIVSRRFYISVFNGAPKKFPSSFPSKTPDF